MSTNEKSMYRQLIDLRLNTKEKQDLQEKIDFIITVEEFGATIEELGLNLGDPELPLRILQLFNPSIKSSSNLAQLQSEWESMVREEDRLSDPFKLFYSKPCYVLKDRFIFSKELLKYWKNEADFFCRYELLGVGESSDFMSKIELDNFRRDVLFETLWLLSKTEKHFYMPSNDCQPFMETLYSSLGNLYHTVTLK